MSKINVPDKATRDSWTLFDQIVRYNTDFDSPTVRKNGMESLKLGKSLIEEEVVKECLPALDKYMANPSLENLEQLADGIVDGVIVLLFLAHQLELPFNELWNKVQDTQWAKVWPDGLVHRQGVNDPKPGKIIKPDNWKEPDIMGILIEWQSRMKGQTYKGGVLKNQVAQN